MCLLFGTFYILRSAHTVYLCVLCGSENKQRLFHCSIDWLLFITETECVYCAVRIDHTNNFQVNFSFITAGIAIPYRILIVRLPPAIVQSVFQNGLCHFVNVRNSVFIA